MKYTIHNTRLLSANELEDILHKSARMYSEYADTTLLFVFREKKADAYDYYEVQFGRNNFMHLAGIKSKNYSATDFYEACLAGVINKADCTPSRDYNTLYAKVSIMMQLLDLKKSKCYKIGEKDLITRDNDFEMATGNSQGIIGYDSRIKTKTGKRNKRKPAVPTTLLNNGITSYCSRPQKIMFILQKRDDEELYDSLFYEIKKGLFEMEKDSFSEELKRMIISC